MEEGEPVTLRRWSTWLLVCGLLVAATWTCWRVGLAFDAVRDAAQRTATAMEGTTQYKATRWLGPPPE